MSERFLRKSFSFTFLHSKSGRQASSGTSSSMAFVLLIFLHIYLSYYNQKKRGKTGLFSLFFLCDCPFVFSYTFSYLKGNFPSSICRKKVSKNTVANSTIKRRLTVLRIVGWRFSSDFLTSNHNAYSIQDNRSKVEKITAWNRTKDLHLKGW